MDRLLLDACTAINLCAGDILTELTDGCGSDLLVSRVVTREAIYVEGEDPEGEREAIAWDQLAGSGALTVVDFEAVELTCYLGFIPRLGDGEAASLAIAAARGLVVATDDSLALRAAAEHEPPIETVTTPEVVSWWADAAGATEARVAEVIARIEERARFRPGPAHPLGDWWRTAAQQS